jgi:hypothetical protein
LLVGFISISLGYILSEAGTCMLGIEVLEMDTGLVPWGWAWVHPGYHQILQLEAMAFTIPNTEASITVALAVARATPDLFANLLSHRHRKVMF